MKNDGKVIRMQYRAYLTGEPGADAVAACKALIDTAVEAGALLVAAVYRWEQNLFAYVESVDVATDPEALFEPLAGSLSAWPGKAKPRLWVPMMDIFHFNEPENLDHWLRKTAPEKRVGKVGVLLPEMVSSYIYYHYGLQEERTFGGDKYEIIALHENLLFGYFEEPLVVEEPLYPQRLNTKSMPENWPDARIPDHFVRWPNWKGSLLPLEMLVGGWR